MPNEPTVVELQQRITQLEQQVADLRAELQEAGNHTHTHPEAVEDTEWGEFNPG